MIEQAALPRDGTEHLRMRARVMAARHPVPAPDGRGWVNVSRWSGSPNGALFTADDRTPEPRLVVRSPGRSAHLRRLDLPVWTAWELPAALADD